MYILDILVGSVKSNLAFRNFFENILSYILSDELK